MQRERKCHMWLNSPYAWISGATLGEIGGDVLTIISILPAIFPFCPMPSPLTLLHIDSYTIA
jgi:hypothetical protein